MLSDTPSQPLLQAHDVCVAIDSTEILHRLNFSVQSGEFLAIRGSNGSGKTTLLRTILNILPVSAGRLELFGKNAAKLNSQDWQKIGYAPQHVTATSIMPATALETVASGLLSGNHLWKPRNWKARAMLALEKVGLERRANESLQTFSGGQQQRVLIARAMVKQPQLLILDEPFSGIDSSSRNEIVGLLEKDV
ncbi:metal ABC transporter ATP-binding protein [Arcanobacterium hippocoleae]|uniref:metal ABC transporter ATP-binding protein n=1 Tax=Arcanobacterium hippocoleae TaxID=149017 RepID=UPI00334114E0